MYSSFPLMVFGFHGCDRETGEAILSGKTPHLSPSQNTYDWLGSGIYFWENSPLRALQWAEECKSCPKQSKGHIKDPFVLGAIIQLGNCLDLTGTENLNTMRRAYHLVSSTFKRAAWPLPENKGADRKLDCLVINAAVKAHQRGGFEPFDTVRGAFVEGQEIYPGAQLYDRTHIQICVCNPACICGYFLPSQVCKERR